MAVITTLGALVVAEPALVGLGAVRLPAGVAYRVGKALRATKAETSFWEAQREAAVREFGEPDGDTIKVAASRMPEFAARMNEIAVVAVELNVAKLLLSDLPDMTPAEIDALDPFIEENL